MKFTYFLITLSLLFAVSLSIQVNKKKSHNDGGGSNGGHGSYYSYSSSSSGGGNGGGNGGHNHDTGINTWSEGIHSGAASQFISNYRGGYGNGGHGNGGRGGGYGGGRGGGHGQRGGFWRKASQSDIEQSQKAKSEVNNESKKAELEKDLKSKKLELFGDENASLDYYSKNKQIYSKEYLEKFFKIVKLLDLEDEYNSMKNENVNVNLEIKVETKPVPPHRKIEKELKSIEHPLEVNKN